MGALVEKCCKCSAGCQRDRQPCVKPGGLVSTSLPLSCTPVILGLDKHLDCQICDTPEDVNETRVCVCVCACSYSLCMWHPFLCISQHIWSLLFLLNDKSRTEPAEAMLSAQPNMQLSAELLPVIIDTFMVHGHNP